MPYVNGNPALVVLHLVDPRGYEYYLWNGSSFEARPDHSIYAINPGFKAGTFENACRNLVVPPHPGALKYYKEKGIDLGKWGK